MNIPYVQTKEDGNTCALFCLANVFNNMEFLPGAFTGKIKDKCWSDKGIDLATENMILKSELSSDWSIDDCCKDLVGISGSQFLNYANGVPDTGFGVFLLSLSTGTGYHRCFVYCCKVGLHEAKYFYVNPMVENIREFNDSIDLLTFLLDNFRAIISLSCFFFDGQPKLFTKKELQHLID